MSDFGERAEAKVRALWKEERWPMPLRVGVTARELVPVLRWLKPVLSADPGLFASPTVAEVIGSAGAVASLVWISQEGEGRPSEPWSIATPGKLPSVLSAMPRERERAALLEALAAIGRVLEEIRPLGEPLAIIDGIAADEAKPTDRKRDRVRDDVAGKLRTTPGALSRATRRANPGPKKPRR